ncbi:MAG: threonine ammonia-lyase, partial [Methanotrichaceae archaeon]|nr:threonine ammonia-lyase [Methanotrichaceae archaeon]
MISLADVQNAARLIQGKVLRTPLVYSPTFSKMTGCQVYLKLENLQIGGSFKVRGATNKIHSHLEEIKDSGVIAASIGNHAQGVALATRAAGVPATIIMPVWASISKQAATQEYGAEVLLMGESLVEGIEIAKQRALDMGRLFLHPYDDEEIIAGQGTIGLEILADLPDADTIIIPVGGGGLIGGIAVAVKALRPRTRIIGVQAATCPSALEALKAGRPVALNVEETSSIADAIMVTQVGDADFPLLRDLVDEMVVVDESQIAAAMLLLLERKKILAEGAGAVPLAALLSKSIRLPPGSKAVLVISGGNVDSLLMDRIIHQGLLFQGRMMRFSVLLEDTPGSLAKLLHLLSLIHISE